MNLKTRFRFECQFLSGSTRSVSHSSRPALADLFWCQSETRTYKEITRANHVLIHCTIPGKIRTMAFNNFLWCNLWCARFDWSIGVDWKSPISHSVAGMCARIPRAYVHMYVTLEIYYALCRSRLEFNDRYRIMIKYAQCKCIIFI